MRKIVIIILFLFITSKTSLAAPLPQIEGEVYIIQTDDWLSKLADRFYGDPLAWPAIWLGTNEKVLEDDNFFTIDNPDQVEVGQKVWIPNQKEAILLIEKYDKLTSGSIVFHAKREYEGYFEIYAINADGANFTRLTVDPGFDAFPAVSPDGKRIAFISTRDEPTSVYLMNIDGSNLTRLANIDGRFPVWSPDGKRLAFTSERDDMADIYVVDADGSNLTRLTENTVDSWLLAWSPDGKYITFNSAHEGDLEIYKVDIGNFQLTRLTNTPAKDFGPVWSPDGQHIAFSSERDGNPELYVMKSDGSQQTRLTVDPGFDAAPAWSPDGKRIAFGSYHSDDDFNPEIYVINVDDSSLKRLTEGTTPAWSPDGERIVFERYIFTADGPGGSDLWITNVDSFGQIRLTDYYPAFHGFPVWVP